MRASHAGQVGSRPSAVSKARAAEGLALVRWFAIAAFAAGCVWGLIARYSIITRTTLKFLGAGVRAAAVGLVFTERRAGFAVSGSTAGR